MLHYAFSQSRPSVTSTNCGTVSRPICRTRDSARCATILNPGAHDLRPPLRRISTCRPPLRLLRLALPRPHFNDDDVMRLVFKQAVRRLGEFGHAREAQAALAGLGIVHADDRFFWAVFVGIKAYGAPLSILRLKFRLISPEVGIFPWLDLGFDR